MSTGSPERSPEDLEQDRKDLRAELHPSTQMTSVQAAWLLGRFLNELRFHLEVAWIQNRDNESRRTTQLWIDSAELIQRALDEQEGGATVELERARNSWEQAFGSEWHSEELHRANESLLRYLQSGEPLIYGDNEVEFLAHVCAGSTEPLRQICDRLATNLSIPCRNAFRLGQIADQLIHPPLCSRTVRVVRPVTSCGGWQEPSTDMSPRSIRTLIPPNQMTQPWPNSEWLRECAHRQAGFSHVLAEGQNPRAFDWSEGTSLSQILDDLTACIPDAESDSIEEETGLTRRGQQLLLRFGLTLNHSRRELASPHVTRPTCLPPRLYLLLLHFLNSGETPTTTRWIGENWDRFSPGRREVSNASVHTAINQLNDLLNGHRVLISSDGGYRLIRTGSTT